MERTGGALSAALSATAKAESASANTIDWQNEDCHILLLLLLISQLRSKPVYIQFGGSACGSNHVWTEQNLLILLQLDAADQMEHRLEYPLSR